MSTVSNLQQKIEDSRIELARLRQLHQELRAKEISARLAGGSGLTPEELAEGNKIAAQYNTLKSEIKTYENELANVNADLAAAEEQDTNRVIENTPSNIDYGPAPVTYDPDTPVPAPPEQPPLSQRRSRPGSVYEMYGFEEPAEEQPEITEPPALEPISKNVYYRDGIAVTERIYEDGTVITEEVINGESEFTVDQSNTFVDDPYTDPYAEAEDPAIGAASLRLGPEPISSEPEFDEPTRSVSSTVEEYNRQATIQAMAEQARIQNILQQQRKQVNDGDWRVKLRLAPGATYLYEAEDPGILAPLSTKNGTGGVVFPYTPQISTSYKAEYSPVNLTHSNYRNYFYQGSSVEDISIEAEFTAQDSQEAQYLLAVIHFFKSVTKMFYGQDSERGAPPPLVFLEGFGPYQFNRHPCVVASFSYSLPKDVDYIRANSPSINGTNMLQKRQRQNLPTNPFDSAWTRIQNVLKPQGIGRGAVPGICPAPPPSLIQNAPTYVPTKMALSITLHPMQSREQVSKQFSLRNYANGQGLRGGFW